MSPKRTDLQLSCLHRSQSFIEKRNSSEQQMQHKQTFKKDETTLTAHHYVLLALLLCFPLKQQLYQDTMLLLLLYCTRGDSTSAATVMIQNLLESSKPHISKDGNAWESRGQTEDPHTVLIAPNKLNLTEQHFSLTKPETWELSLQCVDLLSDFCSLFLDLAP